MLSSIEDKQESEAELLIAGTRQSDSFDKWFSASLAQMSKQLSVLKVEVYH